MKELTLTTGNVNSTLLKFALPFLLANLLQALYGGADLFVVGQFADSAAVSAVAIGSQVMQTITGIVLGISTGATVLIALFTGARDNESTARTIGSVIWVFGIIALVLTVVMLLFTEQIILLMHTPVEAVQYTYEYIFICSSGIIFIVAYNAICGILRGLGDSKTPLIFVAIACFINIAVDFLLVKAFAMGAAGAAIATIFAQAISCLLAIVYLYKRGFSFKFNRSFIRLEPQKSLRILKLGLPIALQDALINVSFLIITTIINTMGLIASASVGVVEKLIVFAMLPPTAFASAVAAMTAQNMGAGKTDRARLCLYAGIGFSLLFGISFFVYCQLSPTLFTSFFSTDLAVIETAALYLKSYSLDCVLVCFIFCMNAYFSGCGNSIFPMIHSLIATFLVRIPLSFVLSRIENVTLYEIGWAAPISTFVSLFICIWYFNRFQRKLKAG